MSRAMFGASRRLPKTGRSKTSKSQIEERYGFGRRAHVDGVRLQSFDSQILCLFNSVGIDRQGSSELRKAWTEPYLRLVAFERLRTLLGDNLTTLPFRPI